MYLNFRNHGTIQVDSPQRPGRLRRAIASARLGSRLNEHWCAVESTPQERQFFIKTY